MKIASILSLLSVGFIVSVTHAVESKDGQASATVGHLSSRNLFSDKTDLIFQVDAGLDGRDADPFVENEQENQRTIPKQMKMSRKSGKPVRRKGKGYNKGKGRYPMMKGKGMGQAKGAQMQQMTAPMSQPRNYRPKTQSPTAEPSAAPSGMPSASPSVVPTNVPTKPPSDAPTPSPSGMPSGMPSASPSVVPTNVPTKPPSDAPTPFPTEAPTRRPTATPSMNPTEAPAAPSAAPTNFPTVSPTRRRRVDIEGQLFNTGVDVNGNLLDAGSVDPHYVVVETGLQAVKTQPVNSYNRLEENNGSGWIWQTANNQPTNIELSFETTFDLTGYDDTTAIITGDWAVDNRGLGIALNGRAIGLTNNIGYSIFSSFAISSGFRPGVNTLTFTVRDSGVAGGLRVDNVRLRAMRALA